MEINNHINGSELINNTTGQNIFQLKSNVGSEPLYFLQDLYTSPTKINIAWKELETMDSSCEVSNNQLVNSKIPATSVRNKINRNRSFRILNSYTKKIKNSLQTVPVYVLVSGRNELVVATTKSIKYPGFNLLSQSKRQKLGFIFFDKREADLYLNEIIQTLDKTVYTERTTGLSQIGLSIHCVGLDYAYKLFRNSTDVDFRFVPSLSQVNYLIENINELEGSNFDESFQPIIKKDNKVGLGNLVIPVPDSHSLNSCHGDLGSFKGVPIYVVQLKDIPYDIVQKTVMEVSNLDDQNFLRPTTQDSSIRAKVDSSTDRISNYVFFDKEQADQFSLRCRRYLIKNSGIVEFSSNRNVKVFSLEGFLEMWEDAIVLKRNFTVNKFFFNPNHSTYFIPSKESLKVLKDYAEQPKNSLNKSIRAWAQIKLAKLRWLQHDYLGLILRGYRL